jgi:hypothetical protein
LVQNTCASTLQGTLTNGTSTATATLSKVSLTWSGCTRTAATTVNGTLELHTIAGTSNATVTANGFKVTSLVPTFSGNTSCVFVSGNGLDLGTLTEGVGTNASLAINVVVNLDTNQPPECPATARWTGTYVLTTPSATTASLSAS